MGLFEECKIFCCFLRKKTAYVDSTEDCLLKKQLTHQSSELRTFWSYPSAPPSSPAGRTQDIHLPDQASLMLPEISSSSKKIKLT